MRRLSKKAKLIVALTIPAVIMFACSGIWWDINRTGFRKNLPWSARNIFDREWDEPGILSQDYCILMRAEIPKAEMAEYMERINLKPVPAAIISERPYWLDWGGCIWDGGNPDWWDPTSDTSGTYYWSSNSAWSYAKWENGKVYVKSYNI